MKIEKITAVEQDCDFGGLTLLSREEYIENKDHIKLINDWWWLRSPGYLSFHASGVNSDGRLNDFYDVNFTHGSVRPALILRSSNLKIGDRFKFYEYNWTVISEKYALCDKPFCQMTFRKYWAAKDANIYNASDIKMCLDNEWKRMKGIEQAG